MHVIASVATYAELRDALRERRLELGLSQSALDYCAGLADGWVSKAEMETGKRWGEMSLAAALGAMGLKLLLVADDGTLPAITRCHLYTSRNKDAAKGPLRGRPLRFRWSKLLSAPAADDAPAPRLALLEAA